MKSLTQFTLVFVLSLSFICSLPPTYATLFRMYHVHIVNNLPGDFALHCQSGDHDLEARILHPNEEQLIRFKINFFRTTRFYCAARWGERYKQFDAFWASRDENRCDNVDCYWSVRDNGFYFSNDNTNWSLEYTWE
ncbi:hypothetical protein NL676_019266 [Syzygium grande]|nr:hypothetical protein NL676_019264 [Syzygium grande]KAI6699147.1 hypothetical protein NL676_019266 [Syzygium grande]